jgi:uncharacterized membrane protein
MHQFKHPVLKTFVFLNRIPSGLTEIDYLNESYFNLEHEILSPVCQLHYTCWITIIAIILSKHYTYMKKTSASFEILVPSSN